jgi:membrane protein implicated in regulation of membrane protease activity
MKTYNTDLIVGIGGLVVTGVFGYAREPNWTPLSSHWPNAILVFLLLSSLFLLVRAFIKPERSALFDEGSRLRMVGIVALLFLWAFGVQTLGFVVASVVAFYVIWLYVGRAVIQVEGDQQGLTVFSHLRSLAVIGIMVGGFYYIFTKFLFVPLPKGWFI